MNFQIRAKAQEYMNPGENTVTILAEADQSRFLNGASRDVEIMVMVEVDFVLSDIDLLDGQRVIKGTVNVTAKDTGEPLEGYPAAVLLNGSTSHFSLSKLRSRRSVRLRIRSRRHPLSDISSWGRLNVMIDLIPTSFHQVALLYSPGRCCCSIRGTRTWSLLDAGFVVVVIGIIMGGAGLCSSTVGRRQQ